MNRYKDVFAQHPNLIIYCDNGHCLYPKYDDDLEIDATSPRGTSREGILEREFRITQIPLPAAVHQYISPNDNKYHGVLKKMLRAQGLKLNDQAFSCLHAIRCSDQIEPFVVENWFIRNFMLEGGRITEERAQEILTSRPQKNAAMYEQCYRVYLRVIENDSGAEDYLAKRLRCELDGSSWQKSGGK